MLAILHKGAVELDAKEAANHVAKGMTERGLDAVLVRDVIRVSRFVYAAKGVLAHEDFTHKSKNWVCSVINQALSDENSKLINRGILLKVARSHVDFHVTAAVLEIRKDKQDLSGLREVWNPGFVSAVREAGYDGMASVLETLGNVHRLFDESGLSMSERNHFGMQYLALVQLLLRDTWWTPASMPSHVLGMPTTVLLAMARNVVSRLFVMIEHVDRLGTIDIVERYMGTYDLERSFSAMVQRVGWKPTARVALGAMQNCFRIDCIRATRNRGFRVNVSQKPSYENVDNIETGRSRRVWNVGQPGDVVAPQAETASAKRPAHMRKNQAVAHDASDQHPRDYQKTTVLLCNS